jgi:hypothetical protein
MARCPLSMQKAIFLPHLIHLMDTKKQIELDNIPKNLGSCEWELLRSMKYHPTAQRVLAMHFRLWKQSHRRRACRTSPFQNVPHASVTHRHTHGHAHRKEQKQALTPTTAHPLYVTAPILQQKSRWHAKSAEHEFHVVIPQAQLAMRSVSACHTAAENVDLQQMNPSFLHISAASLDADVSFIVTPRFYMDAVKQNTASRALQENTHIATRAGIALISSITK